MQSVYSNYPVLQTLQSQADNTNSVMLILPLYQSQFLLPRDFLKKKKKNTTHYTSSRLRKFAHEFIPLESFRRRGYDPLWISQMIYCKSQGTQGYELRRVVRLAPWDVRHQNIPGFSPQHNVKFTILQLLRRVNVMNPQRCDLIGKQDADSRLRKDNSADLLHQSFLVKKKKILFLRQHARTLL